MGMCVSVCVDWMCVCAALSEVKFPYQKTISKIVVDVAG